MSEAPSFNDLVELGRGEAQARRPDLTFYDGDVTEAQLHASAAMGNAIIGWAAVQVRNLWFGGAVGADLDAIILDKLGLPREPATRAYGVLKFSRGSGPTGSSGTYPSGSQIATVVGVDGTRVAVTTDADITIPTGPFSITVNATAVDFGASGNVSTGLLVKPVDSILGGDNTISVINEADFAGGNDSEPDSAYAARARALWQTQRRATLAAIEEGALTVDSVRVAIATEDFDTGIVTLYVSDADGNSNGRMIYDVNKTLEEWRAAGSLITVVGGLRADVGFQVWITDYERGFDVAAAAQTIIDSVVTRINRLRVGQNLSMDSLTAAAILPYASSVTQVSFRSITATRVGVVASLPDDTDIVAAGSLLRVAASPAITVHDGKQT